MVFLSCKLRRTHFYNHIYSHLKFPLENRTALLFDSLHNNLDIPTCNLTLLPVHSEVISLFRRTHMNLPAYLCTTSEFLHVLYFLLLSASSIHCPFSRHMDHGNSLSSDPDPFLQSFSGLSVSHHQIWHNRYMGSSLHFQFLYRKHVLFLPLLMPFLYNTRKSLILYPGTLPHHDLHNE